MAEGEKISQPTEKNGSAWDRFKGKFKSNKPQETTRDAIANKMKIDRVDQEAAEFRMAGSRQTNREPTVDDMRKKYRGKSDDELEFILAKERLRYEDKDAVSSKKEKSTEEEIKEIVKKEHVDQDVAEIRLAARRQKSGYPPLKLTKEMYHRPASQVENDRVDKEDNLGQEDTSSTHEGSVLLEGDEINTKKVDIVAQSESQVKPKLKIVPKIEKVEDETEQKAKSVYRELQKVSNAREVLTKVGIDAPNFVKYQKNGETYEITLDPPGITKRSEGLSGNVVSTKITGLKNLSDVADYLVVNKIGASFPEAKAAA